MLTDHNLDLWYETKERFKVLESRGEISLVLPYRRIGNQADVICPFCSIHLGKPTIHHHGVEYEGNRWLVGFRMPHCTYKRIELVLPSGIVVDNTMFYYLV